MPATWPDTLPQRFLKDGNNQAPGENRLLGQTDMGPGKMRPRSSAVADSFSGTMRMTGAQWVTLIGFGTADLGHWALPFTIPATDTGTWLVRFRTKPSRTNIGGDRWNVSMALDILP